MPVGSAAPFEARARSPGLRGISEVARMISPSVHVDGSPRVLAEVARGKERGSERGDEEGTAGRAYMSVKQPIARVILFDRL